MKSIPLPPNTFAMQFASAKIEVVPLGTLNLDNSPGLANTPA